VGAWWSGRSRRARMAPHSFSELIWILDGSSRSMTRTPGRRRRVGAARTWTARARRLERRPIFIQVAKVPTRKRVRGCRCYRPAMRPCTGRQHTGFWATVGQQWGRSIVWASSVVLPLMAAVWRLLLYMAWWLGLALWLDSLAINTAGSGVEASLGAMGADVRGRALRQERPAERLRFPFLWDVLTDRCAARCTRVEARVCDRAATGVVRAAVGVEGVVRSRWLGSARPCEGTACMRVTVGSMDSTA